MCSFDRHRCEAPIVAKWPVNMKVEGVNFYQEIFFVSSSAPSMYSSIEHTDQLSK